MGILFSDSRYIRIFRIVPAMVVIIPYLLDFGNLPQFSGAHKIPDLYLDWVATAIANRFELPVLN